MFDIDDNSILDGKSKELKYLEEILQGEMKKWLAREFEFKDAIKNLEAKIPRLEADLKASYEEKVRELTDKEKEFIRLKSELEAKIAQGERALELSNEMLKQRDLEFGQIKSEKDLQLKDEEKNLTEQINWLTKKLEEERNSHAAALQSQSKEHDSIKFILLGENQKYKEETAALHEKLQKLEKSTVLHDKSEFELRNEIASLNEELIHVKGLFSSEKETYTKNMFLKQQEITGFHEAVRKYRIDLENQALEQQKELKALRAEADDEIQRLKNKTEEQAAKIIEFSQKAKYANDLEEDLKEKEGRIEAQGKELEAFKSASVEEARSLKRQIEEKQNKIDETEKQKSNYEKTILEQKKIEAQNTKRSEELDYKINELTTFVKEKEEEIKKLKEKAGEQAVKLLEFSQKSKNENELVSELKAKERQIEGLTKQLDSDNRAFKEMLAQKDSELERFKNITETQKSISEKTLSERNAEISSLGKKIESLEKAAESEKQKAAQDVAAAAAERKAKESRLLAENEKQQQEWKAEKNVLEQKIKESGNILEKKEKQLQSENEKQKQEWVKERTSLEQQLKQAQAEFEKQKQTWKTEKSAFEQKQKDSSGTLEKEEKLKIEVQKKEQEWAAEKSALELKIKESTDILEEERKMWELEQNTLKSEIALKEKAEWQERMGNKEKEMLALKTEIEQKEQKLKNTYSAEDRDNDQLKLQRLNWEKDELAKEKDKWQGKDMALGKQLKKWKYTALICVAALLGILLKWIFRF